MRRELSLLKFGRAQHQARNQPNVDLFHRVVKLRAEDLRILRLPFQCRARRVGNLPSEKRRFDAIQRQLRICADVRAHQGIDVDL